MKFFLFFPLLIVSLFAANAVDVGERFQDSQKCKACHLHIVKDWENSWHAKSHYKNDEYFRATIDYVSRKTRKSLNSVKIQCATCHNPRISVTNTGIDYEIESVMGLDKDSDVSKALDSDTINEGINCVVCHNIDKIHTNKDEKIRGINRIEWTKSGVMTGPYPDSNSPYHKVEHRDFMDTKTNDLCFVCHANDKSVSGMVFTNMQSEFKDSSSSCVDCHMGAKVQGVAATLKDADGKTKTREIRAHGFKGAHTSSMWKGALNLKTWQKEKKLIVEIANPQPHNIPSGFGSRELLLEITYKNNTKVLQEQSVSLTNKYISKRGKITIPHLAVNDVKDSSIEANGKKVLQMDILKDATEVEVHLYYRLVNDEVRKLLKLKDGLWSKKMPIASKVLKLKN